VSRGKLAQRDNGGQDSVSTTNDQANARAEPVENGGMTQSVEERHNDSLDDEGRSSSSEAVANRQQQH